jgi:Virulence factor BrkB
MSDSDPARPDHDTAVASSPAAAPPLAAGTGEVHRADGSDGLEPGASRLDRARAHLESGRRRVDSAYQRLQDSRSRIGSVDVAFTVQEGDRDAGGSLLGGAIAFRMFLWVLPAALLFVAGLGFGSAEDVTSPSDAVRSMGMTSIAAQSINQAAHESQSARWLALIFGAVFLYTTSVALVKALFVTHALVWRVPVPRIKHKPRAAGELLAVILVMAAGTSVASVIRNRSPGLGLVAMLAVAVIYGGVWWAWSMRLPHAEGSALDLVPGAIVFGLGVQALHLVAVYYLGAKLTHASALYGSLGIAAALLFGLYLVGRLIVAAAVLNVAIWTHKHATGPTCDGPGRPTATPLADGPDG